MVFNVLDYKWVLEEVRSGWAEFWIVSEALGDKVIEFL